MNIKTAILAFLCVSASAMNAGLSDWFLPKPFSKHPYLTTTAALATAGSAYYLLGSSVAQEKETEEEPDHSPMTEAQVLQVKTMMHKTSRASKNDVSPPKKPQVIPSAEEEDNEDGLRFLKKYQQTVAKMQKPKKSALKKLQQA